MAADSPDQLAWALKALRQTSRQTKYREARSFYDTGKPVDGALERLGTRKFREIFGSAFDLSDNLCAAVVDSVADRLRVTGVVGTDGADGALAKTAWEIWQRNRMDVRAPETHHEALLTGDGYALVWPDAAGKAVIWSIPAADMAVTYDANQPGVISRAARVWYDEEEERTHVDLYLTGPDRVERYASKAKRKSGSAAGNITHFEPYVGLNAGGVEIESELENTFGRVPIIHFPNLRHHAYGVSELSNVLPLQRALNKTLVDLMVAQEFSAFRQRWATGIDVGDVDEVSGKPVKPPFDYGADRMLTVSETEAKFGDFSSTDLTQYVEVLENHRAEIARVSGTPLHYLFITKGDYPSGEAMKSAEARFTRKVENRQQSFGNQWEDLLALALRIEGVADADGSMLSLEWEPASPVALEPAGPSAAQPDVAPEDSTTPTVV